MNKILVTGVDGFLGHSLYHKLQGRFKECEIYGSCRPFKEKHINTNYINPRYILNCDFSSEKDIIDLVMAIKPNIIIHCAGKPNVDYVEAHQEESYATNVKPLEIIQKLNPNILFVFISTNAVFDGTVPPYTEESQVNPLSAYGRQKLEGEIVVKHFKDWLIVRPILLYGYPQSWMRENIVSLTIKNLIDNKIHQIYIIINLIINILLQRHQPMSISIVPEVNDLKIISIK